MIECTILGLPNNTAHEPSAYGERCENAIDGGVDILTWRIAVMIVFVCDAIHCYNRNQTNETKRDKGKRIKCVTNKKKQSQGKDGINKRMATEIPNETTDRQTNQTERAV